MAATKRVSARNTKRRSVTAIEKIAKLAGVSTATVSRIINGPDKVKKRNKVSAIMREHHFVADALPGGLSLAETAHHRC